MYPATEELPLRPLSPLRRFPLSALTVSGVMLASGPSSQVGSGAGAGPMGTSQTALDKDMISEFLAYRPGFHAEVHEGELWLFDKSSKAYYEFISVGTCGTCTCIRGRGPSGESIYTDSYDTYIRYRAARPSFFVAVHGGELWVLPEGSEAAMQYQQSGPLSTFTKLDSAGPDGLDVCSDSDATLDRWLIAAPGYATYLVGDAIWVFLPGSAAEQAYLESGTTPGKYINAVAAGPMGYNVYAVDDRVLDGYLAAL